MLKTEGVAQLSPCHELIKEFACPIAAVAIQVPRHFERGNHAKMVICCRPGQTKFDLAASADRQTTGTASMKVLAGLWSSKGKGLGTTGKYLQLALQATATGR